MPNCLVDAGSIIAWLNRMDLADASLVWLAGEIGVTDIVTVDDSDFAVYRTVSGKAFRNLLPAGRI